MTQITDNEPWHWHAPDGSHRMADPRRSIDSYPARWWDSDERAYVTHLETHEAEKTDPVRHQDDSTAVAALFDLLEAREREVASIRALIVARRESDAAKKALG